MFGMINTTSKFNFQCPGLKVKVTVAILRKQKQQTIVIALAPAFINGFQYIFTQLLGIIISRAISTFRLLGSRSG